MLPSLPGLSTTLKLNQISKKLVLQICVCVCHYACKHVLFMCILRMYVFCLSMYTGLVHVGIYVVSCSFYECASSWCCRMVWIHQDQCRGFGEAQVSDTSFIVNDTTCTNLRAPVEVSELIFLSILIKMRHNSINIPYPRPPFYPPYTQQIQQEKHNKRLYQLHPKRTQ